MVPESRRIGHGRPGIIRIYSKRFLMSRYYRVITLCGSTRFKEEFMEVQKRLTLKGYVVISVGLFGHSGDDEVWEPGTKEMLDDMHRQKIDMAEAIYVINVGGYIGESTRSEIEYAYSTGKEIFFLEPYDIQEIIQEHVKVIHTKPVSYDDSPEDIYDQGSDIADLMVRDYIDALNHIDFYKEMFRRLHPDRRDKAKVDVQEFYRTFLRDLFRCHYHIGYTVTPYETASIPLLRAVTALWSKELYPLERFREDMDDPGQRQSYIEMARSYENALKQGTDPLILDIVEALRALNRSRMNAFIDYLKEYVRFVAKHAGLDRSAVDAWLAKLDQMRDAPLKTDYASKAVQEFLHPRNDKLLLYREEREDWEDCEEEEGYYEADEDEEAEEYEDEDEEYYEDEEEEEEEDSHDMTRDYYGKHGEFELNDEALRASEDIRGFHSNYPDTDLSDHYYWEDVLDAETDDFV